MPSNRSRFRLQRGFSSLALLSTGALLFSSTAAGLLALKAGAEAEATQIGRRPSGPFTQAPAKPYLGAKPGRDRSRGGLWSDEARALAAASARSRSSARRPLWAGDAALAQLTGNLESHSLAVDDRSGSAMPWEASAGGVNTGNGNKLTTLHLLDWKARGGMSLDFTLFHNSQTNYDDELGHGWSWTYNIYVNASGSTPVLHWGDGTCIPYGLGANSGGVTTYAVPAGIHDALVKNADGTWLLTKKDGTRLFLDAAGFLTRVQDRNGNAITVQHNGTNYATKVTDPTGRWVQIRLNVAAGAGGTTFNAVSDSTGRTWTFAENAAGDLQSIAWPSLGDGNAYADAFAYDANHRISTHTDRRGKAWTMAYNADGSLASETDPLGHATTYAYGASATTITDALGHATTYNYGSGALASVVDASSFATSYTSRNASHDVTGWTDARGKSWSATYDAQGNVLTKTDPLGHATTWTYNGFSQPLSVTDALGHATTRTYDASGNLLTVVNALGKTIATNVVGSYGLVSSATNALGKATTFAYTTDGDLQTATDPTSRTTTLSYDALGRPTSATDAAGKTTTTLYDAWERPVQTIYPATSGTTGSSAFIGYLATGEVKTTTDELGHITANAYDDAGRLTSVTNPRGDVESYGYDIADRRTSVTNGRGKVRTYAFTNRGDVASLTMPDGAVERWSYDGAGNVAAYVNPLSQSILYGYDDAGRQTRVDYPTGVDTTFAYDVANRRTSMTDATGTTTWAYDAADRETTFTAPQGSQTSGYDDAGRRTSLTGTGISRTWTYDDAGRIASLLNESGETTTFQYDAAGRLSKRTYPNMNSTWLYDARGRTIQTRSGGNGGTMGVIENYVYDDAGNLTSKAHGEFGTTATVTTTYGYDLADQLTSESAPGYSAGYTYDANGNRTSKTLNGTTQTYGVDDGDKLTAITQGGATVKSYTYDAAGRTKTVVSSAGTTTLNYDYEGRVTSISGPGVSNSFTYNGLDTRVGKTDSTGTRTYRRDGAGVTDDVLSDGAAVYTPGISQRRAGDTIYDLPDRLGSAIRQNWYNGAGLATRTYDAFGVLTASTGYPQGPFGFVGAEGYQEDGDSGLKLLGHRYYDPSAGRFLTRDPAQDGRNWYVCCDNNPLKATDVDGLKPGDRFSSPIGAAKDASREFGGGTHESGGWIYSWTDENGKTWYSYTAATGNATNIHLKPISHGPPGTKSEGTWHTHPTSPSYDDPASGIHISGNDKEDTFSNPDFSNDRQVAREGNGDWHFVAGGNGVVYQDPVRGPGGVLLPADRDKVIPVGRWR